MKRPQVYTGANKSVKFLIFQVKLDTKKKGQTATGKRIVNSKSDLCTWNIKERYLKGGQKGQNWSLKVQTNQSPSINKSEELSAI